jgi:hypothetical protein
VERLGHQVGWATGRPVGVEAPGDVVDRLREEDAELEVVLGLDDIGGTGFVGSRCS